MFICKILLVLFLSVEAVQLFVWFGDWTESSLSFLLSRSTQSTHSYKNHAFLSNIHRRSYSMDAAESNMGLAQEYLARTLEQPGIDPPNFWSVDNPLYLLSNRSQMKPLEFHAI